MYASVAYYNADPLARSVVPTENVGAAPLACSVVPTEDVLQCCPSCP